ncbi:MAG: type II toxin-antitoxin system RelE/ParE family toxin [bacterium]
MTLYTVRFSPAALRQFRKLPLQVQARIQPFIDALMRNPRPHGTKKLKGPEGHYALRVGDYRVIYAVRDDRLMILAIRVEHRRESYR